MMKTVGNNDVKIKNMVLEVLATGTLRCWHMVTKKKLTIPSFNTRNITMASKWVCKGYPLA